MDRRSKSLHVIFQIPRLQAFSTCWSPVTFSGTSYLWCCPRLAVGRASRDDDEPSATPAEGAGPSCMRSEDFWQPRLAYKVEVDKSGS